MFDSEQLAMGFVAINYVGSIINLSALFGLRHVVICYEARLLTNIKNINAAGDDSRRQLACGLKVGIENKMRMPVSFLTMTDEAKMVISM
jgi:hypothetical protein|nr:MAG TPA: hypothetical protein [Caudoviricetes sp.]